MSEMNGKVGEAGVRMYSGKELGAEFNLIYL